MVNTFEPDNEVITFNKGYLSVVEGPRDQFLLVNNYHMEYLKLTKDAYDLLKKYDGQTIQQAIEKIASGGKIDREILLTFFDKISNLGFTYKPGSHDEIADKVGRYQIHEVWLNVTRRCNLKCPVCYFEADKTAITDKDFLTTDKIKTIIDKLAASNVYQVFVSGGEALLRDDIHEILSYLKGKVKGVLLLTNGTLLNMHTCEKLVNNINYIAISLDGSTREIHERTRGKNTYDKVLQGIKNLKSLGFKNIGIVPTVRKDNLYDIPNLENLAKQLEVKVTSKCLFLPTGSGNYCKNQYEVDFKDFRNIFIENLKQLLANPREPTEREVPLMTEIVNLSSPKMNRCGAGTAKLSIDTDGTIYMCQLLHHRELALGDIFECNNLNELVNQPTARALSNFTTNRNKTIRGCVECDVRHFCGGGCAAVNKAYGLSISEKFHYCKEFRDLFTPVIWEWRNDRPIRENLSKILEQLETA